MRLERLKRSQWQQVLLEWLAWRVLVLQPRVWRLVSRQQVSQLAWRLVSRQ